MGWLLRLLLLLLQLQMLLLNGRRGLLVLGSKRHVSTARCSHRRCRRHRWQCRQLRPILQETSCASVSS